LTRTLVAGFNAPIDNHEQIINFSKNATRCCCSEPYTRKMSQELPGQTLQATALVHEAYIRLVGSESQNWKGRTHFFAAAAEAMRRILIDNARRKKSQRRGGDHRRIDLGKLVISGNNDRLSDDILALDEALEKLSEESKVEADVVKLRYFAGMTCKQVAELLDMKVLNIVC